MERKSWRKELSEEAKSMYAHRTWTEQLRENIRGSILGLGLFVFFAFIPISVNFLVYKELLSPWVYLLNIPAILLSMRYVKHYESWNWRVMRELLCRTQWAKDQGYTPDNFMLFADGSDLNS